MGTHIGDWLKAMSEVAPPGRLSDRVHAAQRAALQRRKRRRGWHHIGGLAVAATVVASVALVLLQPAPEPGPQADWRALEHESAELERLLAYYDTGDRVMDMRTAGTITRLEDRIAMIDHGLRHASLEPESRERLLRQRIDLMQALAVLHVSTDPALEF